MSLIRKVREVSEIPVTALRNGSACLSVAMSAKNATSFNAKVLIRDLVSGLEKLSVRATLLLKKDWISISTPLASYWSLNKWLMKLCCDETQT